MQNDILCAMLTQAHTNTKTKQNPPQNTLRRTSQQRARKQHAAKGSVHICTNPLEALAKLRARRERPK